jgi:hypothetical protein
MNIEGQEEGYLIISSRFPRCLTCGEDMDPHLKDKDQGYITYKCFNDNCMLPANFKTSIREAEERGWNTDPV